MNIARARGLAQALIDMDNDNEVTAVAVRILVALQDDGPKASGARIGDVRLRDVLILALNGNRVKPEQAGRVLERWDEMLNEIEVLIEERE